MILPDETREVWMCGPIAGVPSLLQPVAHTLLQARTEVKHYAKGFPDRLLWIKPGGMASVGFHLQHLKGVLDRLFYYAAGKSLSDAQLEYLKAEGTSTTSYTTEVLIKNFEDQVDVAIEQLKNTNENTLLDLRGIGRKQIPATVQGLLFHAAEHTQRHVGQLLVTIKLLPLLKI